MTYEENSPAQTEQTTTLSSTSTSTRFVTVPASEPTPGAGTDNNNKTPIVGEEENSPSEGETPAGGETPSEGSEEADCPAPVTVTVAATTIYVTVAPAATLAPVIPETNENNAPVDNAPVDNAPVEETTSCSTTAGAEATPASEAPAPVEEDDGPKSTIYVIPTQKYSNNTMPASTQGAPAPSGFLTYSRPSGTGSVIEPAPTGGLFY